MNNGSWSPEDEQFVRDNIGKLTLAQMAEHVSRSELAVKLFIHRNRLATGSIKRNLVIEIMKLRYKHPEDFTPSRKFYNEVHITQRRFWDLFYGRKAISEKEYLALTEYFGITLHEAFKTRQLSFFNEENN